MENFAAFLENKMGLEQSVETHFANLGYEVKKVKEGKASDGMTYYVLAKTTEKVGLLIKWSNSNVGEKVVRKAYNFSKARGCGACIVITNSTFNAECIKKSELFGIHLLDKSSFQKLDTFSLSFSEQGRMPDVNIDFKKNVDDSEIAEAYHSKQIAPHPGSTFSSFSY